MRLLIIGYGNPLRGDDGLAWRVAEELECTPAFADAEIRVHHQLTPELAANLANCDRVIFVDAAQDCSPGEVKCRAVTSHLLPARFSHSCSPEELLALARCLYGASPKALLFSVGGACFEHGECLSPAVAAALPGLVAEITSAAHAAAGSMREPAVQAGR